MTLNLEEISDTLVALTIQYTGRIILAIIVLIVGRFFTKKIVRFMSGHFNFRKLDADIQPFLISLVRAILTILVGLTCMSILGFETSSFAAALGAIGLAVGLALQGSLSNFAGGVLILLFKPFRLGEYIFAQGQAGYVESIQIFSTVLVTDTNKTIILPNGSLSTSSVVNISRKGFVKAEMQFQTHSSQDIDSTRSAFMKVINACSLALNDKEHQVLVAKVTETTILYDVKVWVNAIDADKINYYMQEHVKKYFDQEQITLS